MSSGVNKSKILNISGPVVVFILIFTALQLVTTGLKIQEWILPSPIHIFNTLIANFGIKIFPQMLITVQTILIGFIIGVPIGILLAAIMSQFAIINKALSPYIILVVCTPLVALVPLLMIWLGYGINVRIIGVAIQTFPIVMMNSYTGFNNVEEIKKELMQSMGAKKIVTFFRLILPDSLSHVFTGLRLGTIFATTTAISTEIVSGNKGIGNLLMQEKGFVRTDMVFACIIVTALIGILLYSVIRFAEKKTVTWSI